MKYAAIVLLTPVIMWLLHVYVGWVMSETWNWNPRKWDVWVFSGYHLHTIMIIALGVFILKEITKDGSL